MSNFKKVVGIVYAYNAGNEFSMVRSLGIEWIRAGVPFPWSDRMYGTLSPKYIAAKEHIKAAHASGLKIMPSTMGLGSYRFNKEEGTTRWHDSFPAFCGTPGSEEFYQNAKEACAFLARDLKGLVGPLWQHMNEIDEITFHGPYGLKIAADTCRACAEGVMSADNSALCGTNLSKWHPAALETADILFRPGHSFAYLGDDQYYGSWQSGTVEDWIDVINRFYDRYGLDVLANEWGYSSGGALVPEPNPTEKMPLGWISTCFKSGWHFQNKGGHTPEAAAEYLKRGLEIFAEHPHCIGSFMFCWKDAPACYHCGRSACPSECFFGLMDKDLNPKPAYYAVKAAIDEYYK